jgi:xanthine dehydrogenase accessory factor
VLSGPDAEQRAVASTWLRSGRTVVCALLAEVEGSAPLPLGATMLIDETGAVEGSITGGCVESAVVLEAETILAGGGPRSVTYGISDELAGTVGLMCGGIVHIFIATIDDEARRVELAVLDAVQAGRPAVIATLLDSDYAGARLAIVDGDQIGSVGPLELLNHNVAREARALLDKGKTGLRRYGADGSQLGGDLRVHFRTFAQAPKMVIVGAVDFAAALAPIARQLGYHVTICDARETFAKSPRFARFADVVVSWPQDFFPRLELSARDVVLVCSHDSKFDEPALIGALASEAGYIGAMGSRKTTEDRRGRLLRAGVDERQLVRIHAPCGLDIGNGTADETAISILAEIIASRTSRRGLPLSKTSDVIRPREPTEVTTAVAREVMRPR